MPTLPAVRILDKYLLRELLLPLMYCFDAFALLWIVLDLFGDVDDFMDNRTPFLQVVKYYALTFPAIAVQIIPVAMLLALLFCLSNLGKTNELIAMRASGINVARTAAPLLAVGFIASLIVLALSEWVVPPASNNARQFIRAVKGKSLPDDLVNFFHTNPAEYRDWYARRFHAKKQEMEYVEIRQQTKDGSPALDIYAEQARWTNGQWLFSGVRIEDHRVTPTVFINVAQTNLAFIRERPQLLCLESKQPEHMTSQELRRYIKLQERTGRSGRATEHSVTLHNRHAFPWAALIVTFMGIPLGMKISRRGGALLSVGLSIALVVSYIFLTNISLALGTGQRIPVLLAAWMPNALFAGIGAILFWRAR